MPRDYIEDAEQKAVIDWAKLIRLDPLKHPVLPGETLYDYIHATPNGGGRSKAEAGILKATGVKAGYPDLSLDLPVDAFNKLHIEMKRPIVKGKSKPTVSDKQKTVMNRLNRIGDLAVVCYGQDQAKQIICQYLANEIPANITKTHRRKVLRAETVPKPLKLN